eukprot:4911967-Amphidinium_carterae.3
MLDDALQMVVGPTTTTLTHLSLETRKPRPPEFAMDSQVPDGNGASDPLALGPQARTCHFRSATLACCLAAAWASSTGSGAAGALCTKK